MMRKKSSEEMWDGYDPAPAKPREDAKPQPVAAEKPAAPPAPAPEEKPAAPEKPAPALQKLDSRHIAEVFSQLAETARETQKPFRQTLASLNGLIAKCHEAGMHQIGIEHAGFDTLRAYNFEKPRGASGAQVTFALLGIDDARFLIRVHPDNIIDCYASNINKPQPERQALDDDSFWYEHRATGKASSQSEPKFFQYNLADQQDCLAFLQTVIQTAAVTGAAMELREYDLAARSNKAMGKPQKQLKP